MRIFLILFCLAQFAFGASLEDNLKSANKGDAESMLVVGLKYHRGISVPKNYAKGIEWITRAANKNNVEAQMRLGQIYEMGDGTKKDYKASFEWHMKAYESGCRSSMNQLAYFFQKGNGTEKDVEKAYAWFCALNNKMGMKKIENELTQEQIAAAQNNAIDILKDFEEKEKKLAPFPSRFMFKVD